MKRPPERKSRDSSLRRFASMRSSGDWPRRELNSRWSINSSVEPLEPALTLLLIPSDGASTRGLNRTGMKPPNGPAIFGVLAPWTTCSWLLHMVCSWGLGMAYQWTCQNVCVYPPTPHVLKAYNHKVNHDMHKELPVDLPECLRLPTHPTCVGSIQP